jgi:hypothetical protein
MAAATRNYRRDARTTQGGEGGMLGLFIAVNLKAPPGLIERVDFTERAMTMDSMTSSRDKSSAAICDSD